MTSMADSRSSRLSEKINGIRSRRTSAPLVKTEKCASASLGGAAIEATRRRASVADPVFERKSKQEKRSSKIIQKMNPNDIIRMLEMQAQSGDTALGLSSLQAVKNSAEGKVRRSSRRSVRRTSSVNEEEVGTKERRSSKKTMRRTKSLDQPEASLEKSWARLSVDDL